MSLEGIIIVLLLLIAIVCFSMCFYFKKVENKNTWIHTKNGNKYLLIENIKIKDHSTGTWHRAVLYKSLKDNSVYAREYSDFLVNFKHNNENHLNGEIKLNKDETRKR